ncbi:isoprenyl transferase [Crocinitomix catalasitica]|uniref:isoprenyl transferase n=1 Tax=Crocinitomix catalasitica TaxID=184607 RepID=UPI00048753FB|nr:isoprenyl transferase [Crocinitomix catalasitica]
MNIKEKLDTDNIPQHVAIIMDGNGRWAKEKGEMRLFGHATGVESVREALTAASEVKVKYLTLYAFSTENWKRPKEEVDGLMDLLVNTIANEAESLNKNNVKLNAIGKIEDLPDGCRNELLKAIEDTSKNTGTNLILALNYSAKMEIKDAIKKIASEYKEGSIELDEITDELVSDHLYTSGIPDPELMIRTSGEIRISNFLLWQLAYSELHFTPIFWPEFKKEDFYQAIYEYQNRERRFGLVGDQLKEQKNDE